MPDYGKPTGRDVDEHVLQRMDAVEAKVKVARGAGLRTAMDRGDTAAVPEPIEGQTMIQHDTSTPMIYYDGAWHEFGGAAAAATDNTHPPSLQAVPWSALNPGMLDDIVGFNHCEVDTAAISNHVYTNRLAFGSGTRTPAINDYFTLPVTLGPKGSIWGLVGNWKLQSSGGKFDVTLASVPTAGRAGADDEGTLADPGTVTYHSVGGVTEDTYQGGVATYDGGSTAYTRHIRIGGDPGDPFTTITGTDAVTGYNVIDGGPGEYRWKLQVTGKHASSSGYRVDLMDFAWVRITDSFYV